MDAEARALLWRCRRGMKELDVLFERYALAALPEADAAERRLLARLLERYAAAALPGADAAERRLLARLLDSPDPDLAGYFLGGEVPPDPEVAALVRRIRGCGA